jgi:integrase
MSRRAPSYLLLNGFNIYHLRLPVPKHLQSVIKQREIKRSLRTGNRQEAIRKARILAGKFQEIFDYMSKYDKEVEDLLNNPLSAHIKLSMDKKADGTLSINNLEMDPDKIESEKKLFDHVIDKLNQVKSDPIPDRPNVRDIENQPPSISLQKLTDEYFQAVSADIEDDKTLRGYKSHLDTFLEILGEEVPINQITRKRAREAIEILKQLPPNRKKKPAYKDLSIASIIELKPSNTLATTTVKLHIERARALFEFGKKEQLCTFNPFDDLKPKRERRPDQERKVFDDEDIKALFVPEDKRTKDGYPSRLWIPLISAYSGMRLEEIAQLDSSDIHTVEGIPCFDINDSGGKKLKNLSANRVVPIHSKLLAKGFLNFVASQGTGRIFSELRIGNGKYGHHFSKWFGRYRNKVGISEKGKTFHSFRHNVATQLKHADVDVTKAASVLGHTVNGQSYGRYGKGYTVEQLKAVIEIIDYGSCIL